MNDDGTVSFDVNYGMGVLNPRTFAGMQIIVNDSMADDEALVMGGKAIVNSKAFAAMKKAMEGMGATAADASVAIKNLGTTMGKSLDAVTAGTPLDTNPEQTEMERNPLWGAF